MRGYTDQEDSEASYERNNDRSRSIEHDQENRGFSNEYPKQSFNEDVGLIERPKVDIDA